MKRLKEFIKIEAKRLRDQIPVTDKEFTLFNTIKLGEEVGEVNNEILKHFKCGRKEKLNGNNELSNEIADVMISCAMLAECMDLDLNEALDKKIKIIEERYK